MALSRCHVATKTPPPHARLHPFSSQVQRRRPNERERRAGKEKDGDTHQSGGREKVHAREKGRGKGKEQPSHERNKGRQNKGRAQGRGHGKHTASTTPHRDTGEGSTRGTREERHCAPRHARHRHHTHRTHPTSPSSPPSGRAVGRGTAPDLRRPSQWWKAPPRGRPSATPTASNAGPHRRTLWGRCWVPTPAPTAPGTQGSRSPGCPLQRTAGRGGDSA